MDCKMNFAKKITEIKIFSVFLIREYKGMGVSCFEFAITHKHNLFCLLFNHQISEMFCFMYDNTLHWPVFWSIMFLKCLLLVLADNDLNEFALYGNDILTFHPFGPVKAGIFSNYFQSIA